MDHKDQAVSAALAVIAEMCPELQESQAARDALSELYEAGRDSAPE